MFPYSLGMSAVGIGAKVWLIGGALIVASASLAYITHAIASGAASKTEVAYLTQSHLESKREQERLRRALEVEQELVVAAAEFVASMGIQTRSQVEQIERLEENATGKPGICPIHCLLDPALIKILEEQPTQSQ